MNEYPIGFTDDNRGSGNQGGEMPEMTPEQEAALEAALERTEIRKVEESTAQQSDQGGFVSRIPKVGKVIGIMSGKGGVGKSMVTSTLAVLAARYGLRTGILDADITGPSIPMAFGITEKAEATETALIPVTTSTGIEMMSINLLIEDASEPVIWRGPVIAGAVEQFWKDVDWSDLDVMFVDMPPGTGDVPLTVFQSLPVDGVVIVTSPQELVEMIVSKAVIMTRKMNIPVLGLVENMSYFECPDCHKRHEIFGRSRAEEMAAKYGIPAVAKLPIDTSLAELCDSGRIEALTHSYLDELFRSIVD